ncbi:MAG: PilN domain-containing protein [Bacillota bacterium]|nr:PilN domain-containing protein [Bacillota bacterium]
MKDINLLPEEIRETGVKEEKIKQPMPVKTIVISAVVFLVLVFIMFIPTIYLTITNHKVTSLQDELKSSKYVQVRSLDSQLSAVDNILNNQNDVIKTVDKYSFSVVAILQMVKQAAPEGCIVDSMDYGSNKFELSGKAQNRQQAAQLMMNLDRLDNVTSIDLNGSYNMVQPDSGYQFKLTFLIGGKGGNTNVPK